MSDADPVRAAKPKRAWLLPLLGFVAVVALRVPVMRTFQDTWYPFEVHAGTIARALLDGVDLDVARLPIVPHARGCVLFGVLLVPFYAVFGTSAYVMKALPILWHAATIALLLLLLEREGRRRAAIAAAPIFAFAPPMIAKLSTVGLASHLEATLFFVAALHALRALERAPSVRRAIGLGVIVGAAGFFHLQALLPALLVLVLALPTLRTTGARGFLGLAGALALGAAPSFLFAGGNLGLLGASLGANQGGVEVATDSVGTNPPPLAKARDLVVHDFAYALEFGATDSPGFRIGQTFAVLLAGFAALAIWRSRRDAIDYLRHCLRARPTAPLAWILAAHVVGVLALYLVSHAHHQEEIAAGLTNRHLAPVFFSALVLAALGIGELAKTVSAVVALSLPLAAPCALALSTLARPTPANLLPQRGECYEWFVGQFGPGLRRDAPALVAEFARVDRADADLRTLRLRVNSAFETAVDPNALGRSLTALGRLPPAVRASAALELGRALGAATRPLDPALRKMLEVLSDAERSWFLRGIGLGIEPPRLNPGAQGDDFEKRVGRVLRTADATESSRVLEGLGFQLGAVFEPYNAYLLARMAGLSFVAESRRDALWRGVAWGAAQRYRERPRVVPQGLVLFELVPVDNRAEFTAAFTGMRRP